MKWAGLWSLVALPFLIKGVVDIKKKSKTNPSLKPLLGLMGAVIFVISCMPIPVPTAGTCSHPAGTGISAVLVGPIMSIFITSIALLIQALFLAHGGLTTWGADITSMGIVGSFAAYFTFRILHRAKAPLFLCGFMAGLLADWATYLTTSFELSSALHGSKPLFSLFRVILVAFIPTQLPLGIVEGFLTAGMIVFVAKRRPDILSGLSIVGFGPSAREKIRNKKTKFTLFIFLILSLFILAGSRKLSAASWTGVDETVVEKVAEEHGRKAWTPFINTDQGDLLLFVFLLAGVFGGFVLGYFWRVLFVEKHDSFNNPPLA